VKEATEMMTLIGSLIKAMSKIILFGLLAALITPLAYFVWRANQPMGLPQFGGRTYVEWLEIRHASYEDLAGKYRVSHPREDVKDGICFLSEVGIQLVAAIPNSGFYALAGIYPSLQRFVDPRDRRDGLASPAISWLQFLPAWWETYEKFVWGMAEHAPHGPVPYCRILPG
jgi:hypothetical protein